MSKDYKLISFHLKYCNKIASNSYHIQLRKIESCIWNLFRPFCFQSHCHEIIHSSPSKYNIADLNSKNVSSIICVPENDEKVSNIVKDLNDAQFKGRVHPKYLNLDQISELGHISTRSQRFKYLKYLFKKEILKKKDEQKKLERKNENITSPKDNALECDFSKYGLKNNTLLLGIRRKSYNCLYNKRLAKSSLFGSKIVIDLGYDDIMINKEKKSCAVQLRILYSENRMSLSPFDLYLCNAKPSFKCVQYLKKDLGNVEDKLISICEESYTDTFPKQNLVYLSPHADETLKNFDHNAIYVIGGYVDIVKKDEISLEKAKTDGIKSCKLPLDDFVKWKNGSKSLTIDQVFKIMLILKNTKDWNKAFECIPIRKLKSKEEDDQETQITFKSEVCL